MRAFAADLEQLGSYRSPPEAPRAAPLRPPTPPDVPAVGLADEDTLVARIPRTMLVEDLIVRLRATNSLVHQEIRRALRETIVAEHEAESVDGRAATEQAAKLFLDALEITLQSRLTQLRYRFEGELLEELEAHVREWPQEHTALRLQRFLTAGGDASVRLIGEWMSLEPRFGEVVRAAAEVPEERVRDVIEAGAMRNVLAHLAEYKSGKRRRLGGADRWFRVEPRGEGARDVVLRLEALRWLEDLVCRVAEGDRDTLVAKSRIPPG